MDKLNESGLSRFISHIKDHDCGIITAFRSTYSLGENEARNYSLRAKLQDKGFGVTGVDGVTIENFGTNNEVEVQEDSFFVVDLKDSGNLKETLVKLADEFEQDSIMFIPKNKVDPEGNYTAYLVGVRGFPGPGKEIPFNKMKLGNPGEFMTKVSGRPFYFIGENIINYRSPDGAMGKYACREMAKRDWKDIYREHLGNGLNVDTLKNVLKE